MSDHGCGQPAIGARRDSLDMHTASHHVLLSQGAEPPEWVHLVPAGTFKGVDGRGPWKLLDPQAVVTASMAGGKLPIDEMHATDYAAKTGQPAPARGWIVEMQVRDDGIWGRVEWTPTGAQLMSEKAYAGISPVFAARKRDGAVAKVLRAALTNAPNLDDLHTLNSQQETGMDLTALRAALGLADGADEAAILAAVTANAQAVSRHSRDLASIASAAGFTATSTDELVVALQTQRAATGDVDKLRNTVIELQTRLDTVSAAQSRDKATAYVDGQIRQGKPIASLRDHYITRHMADAAAVETELAKLPSINAGNTVVRNAQGEPDGDEATIEERQTAQRMGLDVKKLVEARKGRETTSKDGRTA